MRFKHLGISFFIVTLLMGISFAQNIENVKAEIYSKLKCCSCNINFGKCTCKEAMQMKGYIEGLLGAGVSEEDIFYKVAKKFSINVINDEKLNEQIKKRLILEAGDNRPQLVIEKSVIDIGIVEKKQGELIKEIKLHNKGKSRLVITNIRASCSCVLASLVNGINISPDFGTQGAPKGWKADIEEGKNAKLVVKLDLKHKSVSTGKLLREIYLTSNDPVTPETTIMISGNVVE